MPSHRIEVTLGNETFDTLEDILPPKGEKLKILFVGKVPSPGSVEAGHYWQGRHGQMFWQKLREYNILITPRGINNDIGEDDFLLPSGYGIIDIAKKPRLTGKKVHDYEYRDGFIRLSSIIRDYKPKLIVFIYKSIVNMLINVNADYGFNIGFEELFGNSRVFVFPMPGTPCNRETIMRSMNELKEYLKL